VPELDTSKVIYMDSILFGCELLKDINPYNFKLFDFSTLDNDYLKDNYPEMYI